MATAEKIKPGLYKYRGYVIEDMSKQEPGLDWMVHTESGIWVNSRLTKAACIKLIDEIENA